ncbi:hypothetical protein C2G38_2152525 [Gigaspora rosea]|uniref:DNA-directed DNA polymerase n=1 Tax=Gigaspora rosea TaxID=44941 RepID=A0A397WDN6_9GLOM|nr:hypothetical protein C2G38_2152525 [Gigaspora rosea]
MVWQIFEMKNFGEYHDLYLETDVLLLADVFMNYTIMCLKDDGLDPSHYVSAPGMFNDSLYKSSGVELKLMTDKNNYLIVEDGIRGAITMACHRYAKANNLQCPNYESSKLKFWILYENINALYSGAMTQHMPTEILDKVSPEEVPDIQSIAPDAKIGYTLEVDLEVLSPWIKEYIEENIRKRKIAKANEDEFGVVYYKLKNNAVFSKQMENVRKHMRVKLLRTEEDKKIRRLVSSPLFVGFKQFEGGITAVYMLKSTVTLNKPIYVGQAIFDISKAMMFNFWYSYIKPRYGDKARLLYTDTDSLIIWIEIEDIYKDRAERPDIFDFNYSGNLFLIKDETKGIPIEETVCLKPKMYSVLPAGHDPKTPDDPDSKNPKKKYGIQKSKSVKKCVVKRELRYDKFLECLRNKKLTRHDMYSFRSYDHQIYLERILLDGIRTFPYGHWKIGLYKHLIASEISPGEAEKRAIKAKLHKHTKMVDYKDIELAQVKVIKTALRKGKKYDNLAKNYGDYLKKLRAEKDPNNYIKTLTVKMFPKEEAYTERLENYRKRYEDNDLYSSLEELYELYYHIAKEENAKGSKSHCSAIDIVKEWTKNNYTQYMLTEYGLNYINNLKTPEAWLQFAKYHPPIYIRRRLLILGYDINKKNHWKNFSSGTSALADILDDDLGLGSPITVSPLLDQKDPLLYKSRTQKKRIIESSYKSDKRQKSTTKEDESSTVKKLIKELKDDSVNKDLIFPPQLSEDSYTYLYKEIVKAEANNNIASQKLLNYYFQFGKKLSDRLNYYKNEKNIEIKQTEKAKKIYELFIEIGIDKMEWVKSYSALTISKLSWESIDYIVDNIKS